MAKKNLMQEKITSLRTKMNFKRLMAKQKHKLRGIKRYHRLKERKKCRIRIRSQIL